MIKRNPDDPKTIYLCLPFVRLVFREGRYVGWYKAR